MARIASLKMFGFALALMTAHGAMAQTAEEKAKARDEIWAKEQAIYKGRASGGLSFYLENASKNYVGWPPYAAKPAPLSTLRETSKGMEGQNKEKLEMNFVDFTLNGDTGIIYYMNHRTVLPNGTAVDEKWETIHVWMREAGAWKIVGAMARIEPKR